MDGDRTPDGQAEDERRIADAIALARVWVDDAARREASLGRAYRARRDRMRMLVRNDAAADLTVRLTDEVPRIREPAAAARRFAGLVRGADLSGFAPVDRLLLAVGARVAPLLPRVVVPLVLRRLRAEADGVILPATDPGLARHLEHGRAEGMRANVNVLGEAIVGDAEARRRFDQVLDHVRRPDVTCTSVKISAMCAGLSALAFDDTVDRVAERLRELYDAARSARPPVFVTLDMEEYRDLGLTVAAFRTVLDEGPFRDLDAGIVLQAYLPDAQDVASGLGRWAAARQAAGGGRIKVRLVKGANLAMEHVDAELHGWSPAPYDTKGEVDANYKAVLDVLLDPAFDDSVRIGVGSHNLFDVAWALGLDQAVRAAGRPSRLEVEMLAGMAPAQAATVREAAGELLLYTPVVTDRDFPSALAYLVRRLDENTADENFLAHLYDLADDRAAFDEQAERFAAAVRGRSAVAVGRRRSADRPAPAPATDGGTRVESTVRPFANAPDTDWTHPDHRRWIAAALGAPVEHAAVERVAVPTIAAVDGAVAAAVAAGEAWGRRSGRERGAVLDRVAEVIEAARGRILATMAHDAAKTVTEGDPEVSEAVDFARWYARRAVDLDTAVGATASPLGPVVVTPPWNFPFAIPAGGVLAALAAGNPVLLKPAPQSRATAALLAELCWTAGVDRDLLQYLPCDDDEAGRRLVTHPDVAAVILTGAHDTARMFLDWRPDLRLHAETSGKNAMVITACADLDRAIPDLVRSAFGHAGQKCSAASLAILEGPVHDDPAVLDRIRDAAATLRVGPADDPATDVGPLIEPPRDDLRRALTTLEPGERWLLEPELRSDDQRLWRPGIRLEVAPGSWFQRTECFGPVLGIVRADDLDHAIEIQNSTDYGLTAGLHSLDPDEITRWTERVQAGNLYVNRGTTGAIVRRQPFGGWKRSVVGPTAKAGGPDYVRTLVRWTDDGRPLAEVQADYTGWMHDVGTRERDPSGLAAERNVHRYRPLPGGVLVRLGSDVDVRTRALLRAASGAAGARTIWSRADREPATDLADRLAGTGVDRLRLVGPGADEDQHGLRRAAHEAGIAVDDAPPVGAAAVELPRWLREQAISTTRHRHGRLLDRPGR